MGANMDQPNDSAEEKRLKRMRRNRESAAQSRNRKKQYVEELEAQVRHLEETVNGLHAENFELRREHARMTGQPFTSTPPVLLQSLPAADAMQAPPDLAAASAGEGSPAPFAAAPAPQSSNVAASAEALLGLELLSRSASSAADAPLDCSAYPTGNTGSHLSSLPEGALAHVVDDSSTLMMPMATEAPVFAADIASVAV